MKTLKGDDFIVNYESGINMKCIILIAIQK